MRSTRGFSLAFSTTSPKINNCLAAIISLLFLFNYTSGSAQDSLNKVACPACNFSLYRTLTDNYLNKQYDSSQNLHTAIKPWLKGEMNPLKCVPCEEAKKSSKEQYWNISLLPLVSVYGGYATQPTRTPYEAIGGLNVNTSWKNTWALDVSAFAGNTLLPDYLQEIVAKGKVIPGLGYAYPAGKNYSFQNASGYLSFSPGKVFNFQAGRDKHFWGDGYRSLFLSDVSSPFWFGKINARLSKLKYTILYAFMKDATAPSGVRNDFNNKYGVFHTLSWNVGRRFNVYLFESLIWQGTSAGRSRNFDPNYLNPVVFFRPVEYSVGSSDNALLGLGTKIKLFKKQELYGQLILDEFLLSEIRKRRGWWANKQGFQLGLKSWDLFHVEGLSLQAEFNYVRPYTYSHGSSLQNYSHFNQPLAHPLGANFMEGLGFISYMLNDWQFKAKGMLAIYGDDVPVNGTDSLINYGHNIFSSYASRPYDYGHYTGQGLRTKLLQAEIIASYPLSFFRIEAGVISRYQSNALLKRQTFLFSVGIRSFFWNRYTDF